MTITAADVLAQLQKSQAALTDQLAAASPLFTAGDTADLQRDLDVSTILLAALTAYTAAPTGAPAPVPPVVVPAGASPIMNPTPNDITTTALMVSLNLTGKVQASGGALLANITGNGATVVNIIWPGVATAIQAARTSWNTPNGFGSYVLDKATDNFLAFYGCKSLVFPDGTAIGVSVP